MSVILVWLCEVCIYQLCWCVYVTCISYVGVVVSHISAMLVWLCQIDQLCWCGCVRFISYVGVVVSHISVILVWLCCVWLGMKEV